MYKSTYFWDTLRQYQVTSSEPFRGAGRGHSPQSHAKLSQLTDPLSEQDQVLSLTEPERLPPNKHCRTEHRAALMGWA